MYPIYQAFINSGIIGYAIFFLWVIVTALIMERSVFWIKLAVNKDPRVRRKMLTLINYGKFKDAKKLSIKTNDKAVNIMRHFLPNVPDEEAFKMILSRLENEELKEIYSGNSLFGIIAAIASPIGLFGTCLGMIKSFSSYAISIDMSLIGVGISLAMGTTYLALAVVIITLASNYIFNYLSGQYLDDITLLLSNLRLAKLKIVKLNKLSNKKP